MRIVYFASSAFAVPTLRWLANSPHEVAAVVTQPSRPRGRGQKAAGTPVAEWAAQLGVAVVESGDVNAPDFIARLRELRPALGIVIAFGQKLGGEVRGAFAGGCVNLHGSLLPKYRGAAPVAWAILAGEVETGVTVFRLADRMDAGETLVQRRTRIGEDETAGELHDRLAAIGVDAIDATLRLLADDLHAPGRPQDDRGASFAPKLSKQAGRLEFHRAAVPLSRHVRVMSPWPGARCLFCASGGGTPIEVTIHRARVVEHASTSAGIAPGEITDVDYVATGRGQLEILELQPAGSRVMTWQEFANGRHVRPGDRFAALPSD